MCQDTCETICFKFGMMLGISELYSLSPFWMTLMFTQGDRVSWKLKLLQLFCCKAAFSSCLGFVHPLHDVALHQCLTLWPVCCFPCPGSSLLFCYVVLSSSAWSSSWSLPSPCLPLCAVFVPPIVLHSCYMTGPFPHMFQCVFYDISYLCSFPALSELNVLDVDCVGGMALKPCNNVKYGSFEHLLFLFIILEHGFFFVLLLFFPDSDLLHTNQTPLIRNLTARKLAHKTAKTFPYMALYVSLNSNYLRCKKLGYNENSLMWRVISFPRTWSGVSSSVND